MNLGDTVRQAICQTQKDECHTALPPRGAQRANSRGKNTDRKWAWLREGRGEGVASEFRDGQRGWRPQHLPSMPRSCALQKVKMVRKMANVAQFMQHVFSHNKIKSKYKQNPKSGEGRIVIIPTFTNEDPDAG